MAARPSARSWRGPAALAGVTAVAVLAGVGLGGRSGVVPKLVGPARTVPCAGLADPTVVVTDDGVRACLAGAGRLDLGASALPSVRLLCSGARPVVWHLRAQLPGTSRPDPGTPGTAHPSTGHRCRAEAVPLTLVAVELR